MHPTIFIYLVPFILFNSFIIISTLKESTAWESAANSTAKRNAYEKLQTARRLREVPAGSSNRSTAKGRANGKMQRAQRRRECLREAAGRLNL